MVVLAQQRRRYVHATRRSTKAEAIVIDHIVADAWMLQTRIVLTMCLLWVCFEARGIMYHRRCYPGLLQAIHHLPRRQL